MFERLYDAAHMHDLDFVKSNFYFFMDYEGRRHYRKYRRKVEGNYNRLLVPKGNLSVLVYGDHGNIWSGIYKRKFLLEKHISFFTDTDRETRALPSVLRKSIAIS